ncbi:MAG: polysaccharide lyase family 7 protein, partial [Crocinitomicaceae bacterium]
MSLKTVSSRIAMYVLMVGAIALFQSCADSKNQDDSDSSEELVVPNDIIPIFQHWNLILGDGSNVGIATDYQNEDFFYVTQEDTDDWVVFKSPNAGNTHGTSNNTRTELAQLKKWSPMTENTMEASLKVMNVSTTGDARVAATYSVVVGQIHSADGHEN